MTAPRPVIPGLFLFLTRRCTQRQFLLRPDEETNNAFVYCLAEAAQRFGMEVLLSQMMSNHQHTAVYDALGHEVEFREHFHKMMARSQNALRGRWENFWSSEESCVVEVMTAEDLLDKLVYIATNPVKDGLVEKVHHWPGPGFVNALLTGKSMKAHRPRHFFREEGTMPAEVELVLRLPDHFEGKAAFLDELRRRIAEVEHACARERQQTGRWVVGRRRVLRMSWRDSPTSREPRRGLRPRVAARDKWLRIATLQRNKEWQLEYQDARAKWLLGIPTVFPFGTYWLKRFASVAVKPPPERT
jgi:REP element-mobilizing transposase RayT